MTTKLLMLHDYPPLTGGGLALAALDLARLADPGASVRVLASRSVDHFGDDSAHPGITSPDGIAHGGDSRVRVGVARWRRLLGAWAEADVVMSHWTFSFRPLSTLALWAGPRWHKPTVAVIHTMPSHCGHNRLQRWPSQFRRAAMWWMRRALRRCTRVVAISRAQADALAAMGVQATDVLPVPVAVPDQGPTARRPRPGGGMCIGVAGELSTIKGTDDLLGLVEALAPSHSFRIAGTGPLWNAVAAMVDGLPPEARANVALLGSVPPDEMSGFYRSIDCLLVCSRSEAQCRVALEAMVIGVLVLVRPVEALAELVEDGVTGYFVDPSDPASVGECLRRIAVDPEQADAVRGRGRAYAQAFVDAAVAGWTRLLAELKPKPATGTAH